MKQIDDMKMGKGYICTHKSTALYLRLEVGNFRTELSYSRWLQRLVTARKRLVSDGSPNQFEVTNRKLYRVYILYKPLVRQQR